MTNAHVIKIAKPGESAETIPDSAENIKKFSLVSGIDEFALLKVKDAIKVTIADSDTEVIAHGLEYTPIVWVFMQDGDGNIVPVYDDTSGTYMYVDATNLTIYNDDGDTRDFYYYIFYDEI